MQVVSQKAAAISAVSGPDVTLDNIPLVSGGAHGATIFSSSTSADVLALWARNDAGGNAALFEGSVQILVVDRSKLGDLGALDVRGKVRATNVQNATGFLAGLNPFSSNLAVGVYGESDQHGVIGITNTSDGIGVYGGSRSGMAKGVMGETSGAIGVVGRAGDKAGVAVQGENTQGGTAGNFIGIVNITGALNVNGESILDKIADLEKKLQNAPPPSGKTNFGQPVSAPPPGSRPQLKVSDQGGGFFDVEISTGFIDHIHVIVHNSNPATSDSDVFVLGKIGRLSLNEGNYTIMATDKTPDPNDNTGLLWSESRDLTVLPHHG